MIIGNFESAQDGYAGRVQTLRVDAELNIVPAQPSDTENAPQWRVMLGEGEFAIEIGAGWNRTGARAGAYIAVQIDDPTLPKPLRANLVRSHNEPQQYQLLWSRPAARKAK